MSVLRFYIASSYFLFVIVFVRRLMGHEAQAEFAEIIKELCDTIRNQPRADWTLGRIRARGELLEEYWSDFQRNHVDLPTDDPELRGLDRNVYISVQAAYIEAKSILYDAQAGFETLERPSWSALTPLINKARLGREIIRHLLQRSPIFSAAVAEWRLLVPRALSQLANLQPRQGSLGGPTAVLAILDACSEITIMSMKVAKGIGAPLNSANIDIRAIGGGVVNRSRQTATIFIYPDGQSSPVTCTSVCVRHLGIMTPSSAFPATVDAPWNEERLADAHYNEPGPIELLIGADVLPLLLRPGLLSHCDLAAQNTVFGWTIFGRQRTHGSREAATCLSSLQDEETPKWHTQLIALLQRFWELEDVPPAQRTSPTDRHCEELFAQHRRDSTGRYVVRLPVKPDAARTLGTSEASARATLRNLHRRMDRQPEFAEEYRLFMDTYEQMGHMKRLRTFEIDSPESHSNYIPHHGIWQQGNDGQKLRVVFDASRPTSTGVSLNDVLCRDQSFSATFGRCCSVGGLTNSLSVLIYA
ncbi:unnamed protein product [Trichogramma brassicae]|uniref:Peptidase aspartic putative domain-containing protein n=1 Tax=Trichogramma brassicae TaxID=86971 RepID=A0A6H5IE71_9HYME|nr:unnamed protein product [Trichogramma brassicae]